MRGGSRAEKVGATNIGVKDGGCFVGIEPFPVAEGRVSEGLLGEGAEGI